jgi:hypothetical protein
VQGVRGKDYLVYENSLREGEYLETLWRLAPRNALAIFKYHSLHYSFSIVHSYILLNTQNSLQSIKITNQLVTSGIKANRSCFMKTRSTMFDDSRFAELSNGLAKLQIDLEKSLKQAVSRSELLEAIQSKQDVVILKMQQLLAPPHTNVEKPPTTQHLDGSNESHRDDGKPTHNFSGFGSSH